MINEITSISLALAVVVCVSARIFSTFHWFRPSGDVKYYSATRLTDFFRAPDKSKRRKLPEKLRHKYIKIVRSRVLHPHLRYSMERGEPESHMPKITIIWGEAVAVDFPPWVCGARVFGQTARSFHSPTFVRTPTIIVIIFSMNSIRSPQSNPIYYVSYLESRMQFGERVIACTRQYTNTAHIHTLHATHYTHTHTSGNR